MYTKKDIISIGKILNIQKNKSLFIMNCAKIQNGFFHIVNDNLSIFASLRMQDSLPDSLINFQEFIKTENYESSASHFNISDFPCPKKLTTKEYNLTSFNFSDCLKNADLLSFLKYASTDNARGVLCNVNFSSNNKMFWATDGYSGKIINNAFPFDISLKPETIKLICKLRKNNDTIKVSIYDNAIIIISENWEIIQNHYDYILPDIKKLIPENIDRPIFDYTKDQISYIKAAINSIVPYVNNKTKLIGFKKNEIRVNNIEKGYQYKITLPFDIFPEKLIEHAIHESGVSEIKESEYPEIGFNCEYLMNILNDTDSNLRIDFPNNLFSICIFKSTSTTHIIMPLKIVDNNKDNKPIYYNELKFSYTPKQKNKIRKQNELKSNDKQLLFQDCKNSNYALVSSFGMYSIVLIDEIKNHEFTDLIKILTIEEYTYMLNIGFKPFNEQNVFNAIMAK